VQLGNQAVHRATAALSANKLGRDALSKIKNMPRTLATMISIITP